MELRARIDTPLKRVLDEQGRRQSWLAEQIGSTPQQVNKWVGGLHVPAEATRTAIARALDVPEADLWPALASEAA